jgi:phage terminase large subunit
MNQAAVQLSRPFQTTVQLPKKLQFLFRPSRYKVARGGRGSAKSWSFARALLIKGATQRLRILCAREVQNSIRQSVHKLLSDQIKCLGLDRYYTVLNNSIRGINGTEFSFVGLSSLTVDTIKSFEGYDICWVEEGQTISKRSWDILIPTIRKEGSEIWISYNPDLETDETHQRFTLHPPPDTINVEINWRDNPWFSSVLESERLHCKETDPDNYDNIWEGKCRPAVEGAIYYKQIQEAETNGRICNIPYDPMLRVHVVLDLGWNDSLAAGLVQRHISEIRIIEYIEVSHTKLDDFSAELKTRKYNWGRVWLPHDGFSGGLNSGGKSTYDIMKSLGWDVAQREEITEMSIEEGIRATRLAFPRIYFDRDKCNAEKAPRTEGPVKHTNLSHRLIECLKRYRRHINRQTEAASTPVHDDYAHGADMLRYVALNADNMHNASTSATKSVWDAARKRNAPPSSRAC